MMHHISDDDSKDNVTSLEDSEAEWSAGPHDRPELPRFNDSDWLSLGRDFNFSGHLGDGPCAGIAVTVSIFPCACTVQ